MKKMILIFITILMLSLLLSGCKNSNPSSSDQTSAPVSTENYPAPLTNTIENEKQTPEMITKQMAMPKKGDTVALIKTSMGDIKIKLFKDKTPKTVYNFVELAKKGAYSSSGFHRVMSDFMIQGGTTNNDGNSGESIFGGSFEDEFDDTLHNIRGAVSMANIGQPATNSCQFFIVQKKELDNPEGLIKIGYTDTFVEKYKSVGGTNWLDRKHTVFGQVFEGMSVVDKIAALQKDESGKPTKDIKINSVTISIF